MDLLKHLLLRNYDPSRYVNQVLDIRQNLLTVYLTNLSGMIVGFQKYDPGVSDKKTNNAQEGRYFTHCQRGTTAVWGLETLDPTKKDLYVVEGVFKASALHMVGKNAIAVLTSNPKKMKSWLHTMDYNLIGIGDDDKAGRYIPRICGKGFQYRDLDELGWEELDNLLSTVQL